MPHPAMADHRPHKPLAVVRAKRSQVAVACQVCRQRKTKCDALRPSCTACRRQSVTCRYESQDGETHSQASKRKYFELRQSNEVYDALFHKLATGTEAEVLDVVRAIRGGQLPRTILESLATAGSPATMSVVRRPALSMFLVNLAHSTGSLREISTLASLAFDASGRGQLYTPIDLVHRRDRVIDIKRLESLLRGPDRDSTTMTPLLLEHHMGSWGNPGGSGTDAQLITSARRPSLDWDDGMTLVDEPTHRATAAPWTVITTDDDAVSHLHLCYRECLSSHITIVCPHHADPFEQLQSEHKVAFANGSNDRIGRGQHFHDEALRLWALQENRPSMVNIQALCVLSLESNYRAKDKLGLTLIPIAALLDDQLPIHTNAEHCAIQGISERDYTRARLSTHWTVTCTHIIMRIAFMNGSVAQPITKKYPKIHEVFHDRLEHWIGYPLTKDIIPHRPTLYLVERCRLSELFQQMHDLILAHGGHSRQDDRYFVSAVDDLAGRMRYWHRHLPFELHASYFAFSMVLCIAARAQLEQKRDMTESGTFVPHDDAEDDSEDENAEFRLRMSHKYQSQALSLAHMAAQILSEFRQRYGLKITPAWLLQLQAVAAGVLLQAPELRIPISYQSPEDPHPEQIVHDSHAAYEEILRCLLGTGVQVMIARGIARMAYHTALEQKIALSPPTMSLLRIMSDTSWQPSDLALMRSTFPNFANDGGLNGSERKELPFDVGMVSSWMECRSASHHRRHPNRIASSQISRKIAMARSPRVHGQLRWIPGKRSEQEVDTHIYRLRNICSSP
nr:nitrogen assimilation transcription factor nit-4 [Quercus suber]